jgi:cyclopropane-fatty-acyl-phospholipid synthase
MNTLSSANRQSRRWFSPINPARNLLIKLFSRIENGRLLIEESGHCITAGSGDRLHRLTVKDSAFWWRIMSGGANGAAEAWLDEQWDTPDLPGLLQLLLKNRSVLRDMEKTGGRVLAPLQRALNLLRRNTRSGSRKNIAAHYDLGNDFFKLFLDESMMYSCAWFPQESSTLEEASLAKIERVLDLLDASRGQSLLEIGTGWGALALGLNVRTTTLSREQAALSEERFQQAGFADRIELLEQDYRDLEGEHDRLVSIEMVEAVGHQFLPGYFQVCHDRLKPGGRLVIQAIVIEDEAYDRALKTVDFIKRHIFPGCFIPSRAILRQRAVEAGLKHVEEHDITPHYARTLAEWRRRFLANEERLEQMGYDRRFRRAWDYYFSYCEAGFREGYLGDMWMVWERPA